MSLWSVFHPGVLVDVPGCPLPMVDHHLQRAAIEFFRRTRAWVQWLDFVKVKSSIDEYYFDLPPGTAIVRVERATLDATPIAVTASNTLEQDWTQTSPNEQALISQDRQSFRFGAPVADGQKAQAQVSLMPSFNSTGLPTDLAYEFFDSICAGAKSRVLLVPVPAFYNPELAAVHKAAFEASIGSRAREAWMGHTNNIPRQRMKWV